MVAERELPISITVLATAAERVIVRADARRGRDRSPGVERQPGTDPEAAVEAVGEVVISRIVRVEPRHEDRAELSPVRVLLHHASDAEVVRGSGPLRHPERVGDVESFRLDVEYADLQTSDPAAQPCAAQDRHGRAALQADASAEEELGLAPGA